MVWALYNVLLIVTAIFWVPWMILRTWKRKQKPSWKERGGEYNIGPTRKQGRIWIHAVSVGEVIAARPILLELKRLLPEHEFVLTCTTSTGHSVAQPLIGNLIDYLFYFPIDIPKFCMAALTRVSPSVVVIMETELWLNFLTCAKAIGCVTCLANGRISDKSFSRARFFRFFYRAVFNKVDRALMQTELDAERARFFGVRTVSVFGNSKYDEAAPADAVSIKKGELPLIVVGSARGEFEEDLIIEALKGVAAHIVFAPRHIERAQDIATKAERAGWQVGFRSKNENAQFLILDTFGELAGVYKIADLAIIGGGFAPLGGQNIIQPMAAGCPAICGPHMKNFREPFEEGRNAGAIRVASTSSELRNEVELLLRDKKLREQMGNAGKKLVAKNLGAAKRYANAIAEMART